MFWRRNIVLFQKQNFPLNRKSLSDFLTLKLQGFPDFIKVLAYPLCVARARDND